MSKATWQAHMAEVGFETVNVKTLGLERAQAALAHMRSGCAACAARKRSRVAARSARIRRSILAEINGHSGRA